MYFTCFAGPLFVPPATSPHSPAGVHMQPVNNGRYEPDIVVVFLEKLRSGDIRGLV